LLGLGGSSIAVVAASLMLQAASEDLPRLERRMLELVNLEREARGLARLSLHPALAALARQQSRAMAEANQASHDVSGRSLEERLREALPGVCQSGENIGKHINIDYALSDLLASPGHRGNLLNPGFTAAGVGIARRGSFLFITQTFVRFCETTPSKPR
jgi:uncharacterized protein YkwD